MRIDGMPAVVLTSYSQSKCYLPFDCRPRVLVLHLLLLLSFLPTSQSRQRTNSNVRHLTYFVGTNGKPAEKPILSKEEEQQVVSFCRNSLSNPHTRKKVKDVAELQRICDTLIQEFKRQRDFEKRKRSVF